MVKLMGLCVMVGLAATAAGAGQLRKAGEVDWPFYGGDQEGTKYSRLTEIDTQTVSHLHLAWTWKTGESNLLQYGTKPGMFLNSRYKLVCLDAGTGKPVPSFGKNGVVDLSQGLIWPINKPHDSGTSPPVVYKDVVIVGNGVGDRLAYHNDPPGDVRGFDAHTGKQLSSFRPIPQAGEPGNETWGNDSWQFTGHTNVWAPTVATLSDAANAAVVRSGEIEGMGRQERQPVPGNSAVEEYDALRWPTLRQSHFPGCLFSSGPAYKLIPGV